MAHASSTNSLSSALNSYDTYLIKSITLASSFLFLSLKISIISKLLIKGAVLFSLFASIYTKWLIIPKHPLLSQTQRYTYMVILILLLSKVILLYSYCAKEGLVYIAIVAPFGCQPSSYFKYTRLNIHSSYDVQSISNIKCIYTYLLSL